VGKDIKRYQPPDSKRKYLIFTRHGIDISKYPAILEHLKQFKKELMPKPKDFVGDSWPGRKPGAYEWYEIQDTIDYYQEFEKPKIVFPDIAVKPSYTLDSSGFYAANTCYMIIAHDLYLLGLLNSNFTSTTIKKDYHSSVAGILDFSLNLFLKSPSAPSTSPTPPTRPATTRWSPWSSGCLPSTRNGQK